MKEWLIELQAELDSAVWRMVKALSTLVSEDGAPAGA